MDSETLDFLKTQRVSVISILQDDGTVHAATIHFAHTENPAAFYFLTARESRKCRSLVTGKEMNASVVIGFDENACATFQADGVMKILSDANELDAGWDAYGGKYPERAGARASEAVLLRFIPSWTRFSAVDTKERFKS